MNLLEETIDIIKRHNQTQDNIVFIGSEDGKYSCTWSEFTHLANIEYDDGFDGQEIRSDLIIVFNNGSRMYRDEYDGSEWWVFQKAFKMPSKTKKFNSLLYYDHI